MRLLASNLELLLQAFDSLLSLLKLGLHFL